MWKKVIEKREKANYCTFTIASAVIGILGQAEGFQMERYNIQVADGKTTNDIQMVSFWEATCTQYFELEKVFRQGRPVITMLKNVQGTFRNGLIRLTVQPYTIFAVIHDLTFQKLLLDVQEFHVAQATAVGMEVFGTLKITNINVGHRSTLSV
ncbi:hypothetical protein O6H91_12G015200 [Diphasiastrum complanatum]|uniref:Uncharacterized protein n=1 Tax=Diphasiastrum complanatum TaxID=34168 RepID=A0ACC2BZ48_DIPCM|nr:hypothetical protein O6H91_12G015200 [Diphasiastrum complanatum]